jgi:hypothetical protein
MRIKNLTYTMAVFIALASCASLQAARVAAPLGGNLFKITNGSSLEVGDKVTLIKESYKEYGRVHDGGNTVILSREKMGHGRVLKILNDGSAKIAFEPGARPIKGMKVEKI